MEMLNTQAATAAYLIGADGVLKYHEYDEKEIT